MRRLPIIPALLLLNLMLISCGSEEMLTPQSGGDGELAARVELIRSSSGALTSSSGPPQVSSSPSSIGTAPIKQTRLDLNCSPQGSMSLDIDMGKVEKTEDISTLSPSISVKMDNCGDEQFTGTYSALGVVTTDLKTGKENGTMTVTIDGSSSLCSSVSGDLTVIFEGTKSSGTGMLNGVLNGSCKSGNSACTFVDVRLSSDQTKQEIRQVLCSHCDIPPEKCSKI